MPVAHAHNTTEEGGVGMFHHTGKAKMPARLSCGGVVVSHQGALHECPRREVNNAHNVTTTSHHHAHAWGMPGIQIGVVGNAWGKNGRWVGNCLGPRQSLPPCLHAPRTTGGAMFTSLPPRLPWEKGNANEWSMSLFCLPSVTTTQMPKHHIWGNMSVVITRIMG